MSRKATLTVLFDDSEYRFSHGKAPRGYGSWAFGTSRNPPIEKIVWVSCSTYADAKKKAKALLMEHGVTGWIRLWVQS